MELSQKQIEILKILATSSDDFVKAKDIANILDVSLRTIESEIALLKKDICKFSFVSLESARGKGYHLSIIDNNQFKDFIENNKKDIDQHIEDDRLLRPRKLISILFLSTKPVTRNYLLNNLYVSDSTLTKDLKITNGFLKKYNLEIKNKNGFYIVGSERNIRKCILNEKIMFDDCHVFFGNESHDGDTIQTINKNLVTTLKKYQYSVSNDALENLIIHIYIVLQRIRLGFSSSADISQVENEYATEVNISREILELLAKKFDVSVNENEIFNLALLLKGKRDYFDSTYISKEINDFVDQVLMLIKEEYNIDFLDDIQLRVSLSLHLLPLLSRVRYNSQLKNDLLPKIKKNFQLGFDMGAYVADCIKEKFHLLISEDEISYIAIYFNVALNRLKKKANGKKILIISNLRNSESLLLKEIIYTEFDERISKIDILNLENEDKDQINKYDIVLSINQNEYTKNGKALIINRYPTKTDMHNIRMCLDGFPTVDAFVSLLYPNIIEINTTSKEELIQELCQYIDKSNELCNSILKRESYGGTYFGNGVAIPHPISPLADCTSIIFAKLDKPIDWDGYNTKTSLVFLVSMGKDDLPAQSIWPYLTELINNQKTLIALKEASNFAEIKKIVYDNIKNRSYIENDDFLDD